MTKEGFKDAIPVCNTCFFKYSNQVPKYIKTDIWVISQPFDNFPYLFEEMDDTL